MTSKNIKSSTNFRSSLVVGFLNIRGQSKLYIEKQIQIEEFLKRNKCDILHLQECNIEQETFSNCRFISSNFNILQNNSITLYGTASLVKNDLLVENIRCDSEGRALIFDVSDMTFANLYFHSGTDAIARSGREKICSEVLPNLFINSKETGCADGDFNCIIDKKDATKNPESKISRCLQRLVKLKNWRDSFRELYPTSTTYSRFYENSRAEGASRIDRCYSFGHLVEKQAVYVPVAFSDHFAKVVEYLLPEKLSFLISPKCRPSFRIQAEVIKDEEFKERLEASLQIWERVRSFSDNTNGSAILSWWEQLVKPGIKQLAIERTKEMYTCRKEVLNLLLIRQAYLTRKLQQGFTNKLVELKEVHLLMEAWYQQESAKVQYQSRLDEFQHNEKTTLYNHELLKKTIKKSSILRL